MELGGSDPFIVMPSADLEKAATTAVKARISNNGQSCIAAKRFLVHTDIYDAFVDKFVERMEGLKVGMQRGSIHAIAAAKRAAAGILGALQVPAVTVAGEIRFACTGPVDEMFQIDRGSNVKSVFAPTGASGAPITW